MKRPKAEFRYENRIDLYLLKQKQGDNDFYTMNYKVITPEEWIQFYIFSKEDLAEKMFNNSKKQQTYGNRALKDLINIQALDLPHKIAWYINKSLDVDLFIAVEKRVQSNEENNVTDQVIVNAIMFEREKDTIVIHYITRFFQGILFQFHVENKNADEYERFSVDKLFSFVMEQVKKIPGVTTIKIQLVSEGSKRLIEKHLLSRYFQKKNKNLPVVHDTDEQYFPLKYLQFKLCSYCINNIATVKWENQDKYSFCDEECARLKWESF